MVNISSLFVVLVFLSQLIQSKMFEQNFNIHSFRRNEGWNYVGRMNLNPGKLQLDLNINIEFPDGK